jgi:valyl-tRNA synthetase
MSEETPDAVMTPATDDTPIATPLGDSSPSNNVDGEPTALSKSQLKKLAKGKTKEKKEKPQWGDGSKRKEKATKKEAPPKPVFTNETPKGQKKDLTTTPMADAYHPQAVESAWQDWWEAAGYYKGQPAKALTKSDEEKFVMVIPPPNVTGSLHLGHALTAAVEDTLTRWHRMKGHATLYVPGMLQQGSFYRYLK